MTKRYKTYQKDLAERTAELTEILGWEPEPRRPNDYSGSKDDIKMHYFTDRAMRLLDNETSNGFRRTKYWVGSMKKMTRKVIRFIKNKKFGKVNGRLRKTRITRRR